MLSETADDEQASSELHDRPDGALSRAVELMHMRGAGRSVHAVRRQELGESLVGQELTGVIAV
eukprot:3921815-Pleurochrysis_carterae.AAC.6